MINEKTERRKATMALVTAILGLLTDDQRQVLPERFEECVQECIASGELPTDPLHDEISFIRGQIQEVRVSDTPQGNRWPNCYG